MQVRLSLLAAACVMLGSQFFFGCRGLHLREAEQIKADLVGMGVSTRTNPPLGITPDLAARGGNGVFRRGEQWVGERLMEGPMRW